MTNPNNELSIEALDAVVGGDANLTVNFWGVRLGITQSGGPNGTTITCTTIKSDSGTQSSCTIK